MKGLLLCLIPIVLAAPHERKRFFISTFQFNSPFDMESLRCDVQIMLDVIGSDATEKACEDECHKLVVDGNVLEHGCPLLCHVFQNLAHYFHETPKPGDQNLPCGGLTTETLRK